MSTLTISAPMTAPRRSHSRATVTMRPCGAVDRHRVPGTAASVRRGRTTSRAVRTTGAVRLTRRGRVVVLLLLLAVGAVLSLAITSSGAASGTAQQVPVQYVTVAPGDTLWSIAGEVAPDADPRDTLAEIIELNALDASSIRAGQRIAVPLGR
jgi:LysM repeat protein